MPQQGQTHLKIDLANSGANNVVAAVAGQRVYVFSGCLVTAGTMTVDVRDGATTSLSGVMSLVAGQPLLLEGNSDGSPLFTTTAGNVLNLQTSGVTQVSGWLKVVQQ